MVHDLGFPVGSEAKASACNVGDLDSIPGSGRSPGGGHGYPLQYSCLENSWTEEPGGLQSMRSQRVGHDLTTNTHTFKGYPEKEMAIHFSIPAWRISMDRGAWRATVYEMAKSRTQLSD